MNFWMAMLPCFWGFSLSDGGLVTNIATLFKDPIEKISNFKLFPLLILQCNVPQTGILTFVQ